MQTDILLKQLNSSLQELKTAIDKFEKHPSPSTQYAEQLHKAIHQANKLVSAYLVIKEQKDVSPELNLHVKLMNIVSAEENLTGIEPLNEPLVSEPAPIVEKEEEKTIDVVKDPIVETIIVPVIEIKKETKELPKVAININDKFRFINELFASNANEYHIAIEQINSVNSLVELNNYLKGLKSIYMWNDDNEVVKNLCSLAQKRFS
jgi:hypothetical protein